MRDGKFSLLMYAYNHGCVIKIDMIIHLYGIELKTYYIRCHNCDEEHLKCIDFLLDNHFMNPTCDNTICYVTAHGHIKCIDIFVRHGYKLTQRVLINAIYHNQFECVKHLFETYNIGDLCEDMSIYEYENVNVDILRYIISKCNIHIRDSTICQVILDCKREHLDLFMSLNQITSLVNFDIKIKKLKIFVMLSVVLNILSRIGVILMVLI